MPEAVWLGAALGTRIGGSTLAHAEAEILAALRAVGLRADLVSTSIDRTATVATITASARLVASIPCGALDLLATRLEGVVVALDADAAVTSAATEPTARIDAAAQTARAAATRTEGRCVRFPGQQSLVGVHSVTEIVTDSAVDRVAGVGVAVAAEDMVDTGGFLRPQFQSGELVLLVEPAADGVLRPVEVEHPHECCGQVH